MKLVIIESPFSAATAECSDRYLAYARRAVRHSILQGEAPVAFHLLYTQAGILSDESPEARNLGITLSEFWWEIADLHTFYTDCGWSRGMLRAWDWCTAKNRRYDLRSLVNPAGDSPPADIRKEPFNVRP